MMKARALPEIRLGSWLKTRLSTLQGVSEFCTQIKQSQNQQHFGAEGISELSDRRKTGKWPEILHFLSEIR